MSSERKFVTENIRRLLLKEYLMRETARAGFGGVEIQRTPMGTRVTLFTERPGLVIGRKGEAIYNITNTVSSRFKYDNPQIEVQEVDKPSLNPQIMAEKLASALERGWHFRRAGHSTVQKIMDAGAKGCRIVIAGKLTGERHRTEKFVSGTIKFCGDTARIFMKKGFTQAKLKPGVMGVTVEIMIPDAKLPDLVTVFDVVKVTDETGGAVTIPMTDGAGAAAPDAATTAESAAAEPAAAGATDAETKATPAPTDAGAPGTEPVKDAKEGKEGEKKE
jgi:small subunit ribosomal protein S3